MRHCLQCTKPLVDEKGKPIYNKTLHDECAKRDRREKLAAKRAKLKTELMRRVARELNRRCKKCPSCAERGKL
jgi:hypothetical protein